jgi:hypothetical protein
MITAVAVDIRIDVTTMKRRHKRNASSHRPASANLFEVIIPDMAPTMKTSP